MPVISYFLSHACGVCPRCENGTTDEICSAVDGIWDLRAPRGATEICRRGKWYIPEVN